VRQNTAEVWIAEMAEFTGLSAELDRLLSDDERAHVQRFRAGGATLRLSRALLRLVLADYLHVAPTEVEIDRSCPSCGRSHGKPRLRRPYAAAPALHFSVAHGGDLLVLALADAIQVGVDVEPWTPEEVAAELLEFALTPAEHQLVQQAPVAERSRVFARYWTGKEAVLKALGSGLDVHLQAVRIPPLPGGGMASVTLPGSPPREWWVRGVDVGHGHVCSLATGEQLEELRLIPLSPDFVLDSQSG